MTFFDDAAKFMQNKQPVQSEEQDILNLDTPALYDAFFDYLRKEYENATRVEIERAITQVENACEKPYNKKEFLKKIRIKLED